MPFQRTLFVFVSAFLGPASFGALPARYEIVELPAFCNLSNPDDKTKCGLYSYGYGINDDGTVTGFAQGALIADSTDRDGDGNTTEEIRDFSVHAFRWSDGVLEDLGHLGKDESYGNAINNDGVVVGRSNLKVGTTETNTDIIQFRGFIATPNAEMAQISDPADVTINSLIATDIDSEGYVVGYVGARIISGDETYYTRGFVHSSADNSTTLIPALEEKAASVLRSVDSSVGIAVGYSIKNAKERAISVSLTNPAALNELGDLGGGSSTATDINKFGVIVGTSSINADGVTEGFVYDGSGTPAMTSIGVLNDDFPYSSAKAINDDGVVVGVSVYSGSPTTYRAIAYDTPNARLVNLNELIDCQDNLSERWTLVEAVAVNNSGQIIGYGVKGSTPRGFLLTPDSSGEAPTPCTPNEGEFENQSGGGTTVPWMYAVIGFLLLCRRRSNLS